ncbi:hypothetical protein BGW41_003267 [Actinomortierella wolfii]|nr:hypothetical protein BGW41_003267 [Actinomortierella wolfii]
MAARETSARLNSASTGDGSNSKHATSTATTVVSLSAAESSDDVGELRRALQEANEKIKQQKAQIKKLQHEVDVERGHATILRHDNQVLRQKNVNLHAVAEQEEENISNRLLKRISGLKKEKGELMLQVEQEEEYLTQTLQKKLQQLQKEKIDMENALEQEQEYIVNRLQKQLEALRMEQSGNASAASSWHDKDFGLVGSSPINIAGGGRPHSMTFPNPSPTPSPTQKKWIPGHSPSSSSDHGPSHPMFDMIRAELAATKATLNELEREYMVKFRQCNRLKSEVLALRQELGLPIGSDLTMEESLPTILSSSVRGMSSNTPSRRNSRNSVTGSTRGGGGSISGASGIGSGNSGFLGATGGGFSSSSYGTVPATPSNTPANPAPINSHHFAAHRPMLTTQQHSVSSQAALQPHDPLATSPIVGTFPGAPLSHERGPGAGSAGPGHHHSPVPPSHHQGSSTATSGTNSMASSVGSLGSTSPLMSSSYSSTSSSALPSIVPERQSLYRSKSGSSTRQLGSYSTFMNNTPQPAPYQPYHPHHQSHHHPPHHHYPYYHSSGGATPSYQQHRQSWSGASTSHPNLPMWQQSANTSSSSVASSSASTTQQQPQSQHATKQQTQPQSQPATPTSTSSEVSSAVKAEVPA